MSVAVTTVKQLEAQIKRLESENKKLLNKVGFQRSRTGCLVFDLQIIPTSSNFMLQISFLIFCCRFNAQIYLIITMDMLYC